MKSNRGTATLPVTVPGAGVLTLTGEGVFKQNKTLKAATTAKLLVKAKGRRRRALARTGKLKVKTKVTFAPTSGIANAKSRKLTLRKASR